MEDEDVVTMIEETTAQVGRTVRQSRLRRQMSQQNLADRMNQLGSSWTQTTVYKIEAGQRSVRLTEAIALALSLGLPTLQALLGEDSPVPGALVTGYSTAERRQVDRALAAALHVLPPAAAETLRKQMSEVVAAVYDSGLEPGSRELDERLDEISSGEWSRRGDDGVEVDREA